MKDIFVSTLTVNAKVITSTSCSLFLEISKMASKYDSPRFQALRKFAHKNFVDSLQTLDTVKNLKIDRLRYESNIEEAKLLTNTRLEVDVDTTTSTFSRFDFDNSSTQELSELEEMTRQVYRTLNSFNEIVDLVKEGPEYTYVNTFVQQGFDNGVSFWPFTFTDKWVITPLVQYYTYIMDIYVLPLEDPLFLLFFCQLCLICVISVVYTLSTIHSTLGLRLLNLKLKSKRISKIINLHDKMIKFSLLINLTYIAIFSLGVVCFILQM